LRAALASRGLRTQPGLDSSTFSFAPLFGNRALSPHGAPYPGCWGCTVCFLQNRRCPADRVPGLSDKAQAVFAQPPADALDRFQTPCAPHRVRMLYAATQVQPPLHMARCLSVKRTSLCGSPTESAPEEFTLGATNELPRRFERRGWSAMSCLPGSIIETWSVVAQLQVPVTG